MRLFPYYKQVALDTGHTDHVDLNTDDLRVLCLNGYTFDAADQYVSHVLAGPETELGRSLALASVTVTNGVFDCANPTVSGIAASETITDLIIFKHTGADGTATAVCHLDQTPTGAPLAFGTIGGDVLITIHPFGVFEL